MRSKLRLLFTTVLIIVFIAGCGRTASRLGGKEHRQVLEVEATQVISVSFDKNDGSTVKDVTFLAKDGYFYTQEFTDILPLEGAIRWVPNGEDSDFIQTRAISRWFGGAVNLKLPADFQSMIGVDIGYAGKDERVKNLTYVSTDSAIYSREYREGIIDRNFEGWLEIKIVGSE